MSCPIGRCLHRVPPMEPCPSLPSCAGFSGGCIQSNPEGPTLRCVFVTDFRWLHNVPPRRPRPEMPFFAGFPSCPPMPDVRLFHMVTPLVAFLRWIIRRLHRVSPSLGVFVPAVPVVARGPTQRVGPARSCHPVPDFPAVASGPAHKVPP